MLDANVRDGHAYNMAKDVWTYAQGKDRKLIDFAREQMARYEDADPVKGPKWKIARNPRPAMSIPPTCSTRSTTTATPTRSY